jgi:hypothetical protein
MYMKIEPSRNDELILIVAAEAIRDCCSLSRQSGAFR